MKNKAPEALITAAGLYRKLSRVNMTARDDKPTIEVPPGSKDAPLDQVNKLTNFEKESKELLDQARLMGLEMKLDLDPLIKAATTRELKRYVVGGPKYIARQIGPGQQHQFRITIQGNPQHSLPSGFAFGSTFPMNIGVQHGNHVWVYEFTQISQHMWWPGGNCNLLISVRNPTGYAGSYEIFVE